MSDAPAPDVHDESGSEISRGMMALLSGGAALIVVIVIAVGFGISTGATPKKPETITQSGPPASQLEQAPQSGKIGDGTGE